MPQPVKDLVPAVACAALAALASGCAATRLPPLVWATSRGGSPPADGAPGGRRVRNFLGILHHQAVWDSDEADAGRAPADAVTRKSSLHTLLGLYHRTSVDFADGRRTAERGLIPFVWTRRQAEPRASGPPYTQLHVTVPPLIAWLKSDNYGAGVTEAHFLYPLGHYFRGERLSPGHEREFAKTLNFLPLWRYERSWRPSVGRNANDADYPVNPVHPCSGPGCDVRFRILHVLFGYKRNADTGRKSWFLLGGTPSGPRETEADPGVPPRGGVLSAGEGRSEGTGGARGDRGGGRRSRRHEGGGEHTWALWAYQRGPATDREHQFLYEFLLVKRSGSAKLASSDPGPRKPSDMWRATKWLFRGSPRTVVNLGPVASFESDWESDREKFTLFFGFLSYQRTGDEKRGRLLWVIPWRAGGRRARGPRGEGARRERAREQRLCDARFPL